LGRAIASQLPPARISEILGQSVPVDAGPGAIRDSRQYQAAVEKGRQNGYAIGREEIPGWDGIASPVMWGRTLYRAVVIIKPAS
jgi:DNA-binding IclR family transcriptional regulator